MKIQSLIFKGRLNGREVTQPLKPIVPLGSDEPIITSNTENLLNNKHNIVFKISETQKCYIFNHLITLINSTSQLNMKRLVINYDQSGKPVPAPQHP